MKLAQTFVAILFLLGGYPLAAADNAKAPGSPSIKIVLVGDSTTAPSGGWGPGFCPLWMSNVICVNDALGGRSTKSYIDEGAWSRALKEKGNYYLIQFGHNDQKLAPNLHTDADTTFPANLKRFIADVRAIGGTPVLITSLSRRTFENGKVIEDLTLYANATRRVGAEEHVAVIDLNAMSVKLLNTMTQEQADRFDAIAHPDAAAENATKAAPALDRTHLNEYGKKVFGWMVANELVRLQVELAPYEIRAAAPA
jgi:lysophospholipase L1-like esterase